ncbi:hypothetical protein ACIQ9J_25875 [Streptomyces sp. NPDC094153]|uniref:hypothetical protein n=1 Tax=Streptomyces sp. NPDC094153 TaxID=3366058 RepID=UPI00381B0502
MTEDFTDADTKAICALLGIETKTVTDTSGRTLTVIDETGMRKLADHAPVGATAAHAMVDQFMAAARTEHKPPLARIRTDVVALLLDLDVVGSGGWAHRDGRPLTSDERSLVSSATAAECHAAAEHIGRALDEQREDVAALARIRELSTLYFEKLPAGSTMADVMALMTADERAEIEGLAASLPVDGTVIVPRSN